MEFSFFTTDNKSGFKTQEKWFSKNFPDEYEKINEYSNSLSIVLLGFKEKIWFFYNNLTERPKCKSCGEEIKFRNRFDKPFGDFCSLECINNNKDEMSLRQKKTFNEKYGVYYYPQHKDFLKKQKETKLYKYGDENFNNIEKGKKTKQQRYGNENYVNTEKYIKTCLSKYGTDNYSKSNNYQNKITKTYKELYPDINFVEINKLRVKIKCEKCGETSELTKQLLYERYKRGYETCTHCNPIGQSLRSGIENEVSEFLKTMSVDHTVSSKILGKRELDILIPEHNTAIEFNGVYWHNELFVTSDYHLKKTVSCQEIGIELIHIFEDEWLFKKDIVKSIIRNRVKKINNTIFARKCVIKEIDSKLCKEFLENNHIQGNVNSKIKIGLFLDKELVSLMTFSKGRILMGGKSNEWELTRFCNKINTNVIGAAGRLFNYFKQNYEYTKIVSYSDIRLFNGNLYPTLGFVKKSQSKPNYWYVINGMRYYRFNFRKDILVKEGFDKNKSEREIMFDRKIYRIYDCGNIRWEFNKNFTS